MSECPLPLAAGVMESVRRALKYPRSRRYCRKAACTTVVSDGGASWDARYLSTALARSSGKVMVARFMHVSISPSGEVGVEPLWTSYCWFEMRSVPRSTTLNAGPAFANHVH